MKTCLLLLLATVVHGGRYLIRTRDPLQSTERILEDSASKQLFIDEDDWFNDACRRINEQPARRRLEQICACGGEGRRPCTIGLEESPSNSEIDVVRQGEDDDVPSNDESRSNDEIDIQAVAPQEISNDEPFFG